jgi:hypothetical protein
VVEARVSVRILPERELALLLFAHGRTRASSAVANGSVGRYVARVHLRDKSERYWLVAAAPARLS